MFFFFAEVHHEFNLSEFIFDPTTNVINWLLLVGFLIYGYTKLVPPMLAAREQSIKDQLAQAEKAREESQKFLAEQEVKIQNAEKEAANIISEAKTIAEQMKKELIDQTKREIADLERKFESAIANERQVAITEIRTAAAKAAIELSKSHLEKNVSADDNKRLLSEFMSQLDSMDKDQAFAPGGGVNVR